MILDAYEIIHDRKKKLIIFLKMASKREKYQFDIFIEAFKKAHPSLGKKLRKRPLKNGIR